MKILGIDPGSRKSGFSLIETRGSKHCEVVHCDSVRFNSKLDFTARVPEIKNSLKELMELYRPDHVAIESLIYVKSPTALMKLAQTRGIFLSVVTDYTDKIFEYSPNLVKMVVTGHGHCDKQAIQLTLQRIFNIKKFHTDDESDALAVALCHHLQKGQSSLNTKSKGSGSIASSVSHRIKESDL